MGGWPVGFLQGMEELNSGTPKTNPSSGGEEDLNPGPPDYKSSALPLGHARLPSIISRDNLISIKYFVNQNWALSSVTTVDRWRPTCQEINQSEKRFHSFKYFPCQADTLSWNKCMGRWNVPCLWKIWDISILKICEDQCDRCLNLMTVPVALKTHGKGKQIASFWTVHLKVPL